MNTRVAVFDMDHTLIDSKKKLQTDVAEAMGRLGVHIPIERVEEDWYALAESFGLNKEEFDKELSKRKTWEEALRDGDVPIFPDTLDCLDTLQNRGTILALFTRSNQEYTRAKIDHFGLEKYFQDRIEITPVKSKNGKHAEVRNLIHRLNPSPESEIYFIGDKLEDVEVADSIRDSYQLNANGIYLQRSEGEFPEGTERYHQVISLEEVPRIILR